MMKWHHSKVAGVSITSISDFICKQSKFDLFSAMFYGFYFCASIQVYLIDVLLFSFLKSVNWGLHCIAIRNAFLMLLELGIVFCQHIN